VTTNNVENAKKSEVKKKKGSRLKTRAILTKTERSYLEEGRTNDRHKEFLIKLKTKKALNEDLPLIAQTRPEYIYVITSDTTKIFEKQLKRCMLHLYWIYENKLANERSRAKIKSKVSEKIIFGRINENIKESKEYIHNIIESIRKKQSQN